MFCAGGDNYIRLWKVMSGVLKGLPPFIGLPREYKASFIDICWLDNEIIIIAAKEGDLLVIQENELKQKIDKSHGSDHIITAICRYDENSFMTVGDGGIITIYTPANAEEKLRYQSLYQVFIQTVINRPPEYINNIYGVDRSPNAKTYAILFNDSFSQFTEEDILTWENKKNVTVTHYPT